MGQAKDMNDRRWEVYEVRGGTARQEARKVLKCEEDKGTSNWGLNVSRKNGKRLYLADGYRIQDWKLWIREG